MLAGFYRFALARSYATTSPLPEFKPNLPPPQTPYIYSRDELRRLLDATTMVDTPCSRLQVMMYRTLLLMLYGAGLRVSEAIHLTVADVNLIDNTLMVRNTKFYNTRLVPIGPQLASVLTAYYTERSKLPMPKGRDSGFLCSRTGNPQTYQHIVTLFQRIRTAAGIVCPPNEPRPPRLHDLRHTAAVHRVVAWYRSGKDVQQLLPRLATYLGHVNIASTQRYLHMTPELLQAASRRFEAYGQPELAQEVDHVA
jgi:site-specific recombinase XerD